MSVKQSPEAHDLAPNGSHGAKRESSPIKHKVAITGAENTAGRRGSTILNPKSYVKEELWRQAPVFTGSTKFEPLPDAKSILVTGGAGFMCVHSPASPVDCELRDSLYLAKLR